MEYIFYTVSVARLLAGGLFAGTYSGGSGTSGFGISPRNP